MAKTTHNIRDLAKEIGSQAVATTRDKMDDMTKRTERLVRDNPWTSLAIAAAVGAVVALSLDFMIRSERKTFLDRLKDKIY